MVEKNSKRSNRFVSYNGIIDNYSRSSGSSRNRTRLCCKSFKGFTHKNCRKYNKGFKGLLKNTDGFMSTIEFLFWLIVIIFVLFGGIDYYITEVQYNIVEETTNFYLSKMRFAGTLYDDDKQNIVDELSEKGFENINVVATDGYGNELSDEIIITRNIDDLMASKLYLEVTAEPYARPFMFGRFLGIKEDDGFYFKVDRRAISERPAD